ncbi:site-specific recombinase [Paraperlucidibaca baekdonensis]|uniref:Site-specific recombinase n=1 Tax=Paraperlucidibaca baekdonensis TaxID=748120 RepID=A0A3E0HAG5_9GAMM|nr:site-specific recombinase [Paraperlucidibaca baekdonensis]REH40530.1 site-specific recombinase [Paraperlucidibaca baekdonensis]
MLKDILEEITRDPETDAFRPLGRLLKQLRPEQADDSLSIDRNFEALLGLLSRRPELRAGLQRYIDHLLVGRRQIHLYTDTGILSSEGLAAGFWRRVGERLLPPISDDQYLDEAFSRLIRRGKDADWIEAVPDETWARVFEALLSGARPKAVLRHTHLEQLDALRVLAHRVCAMGLEPELVRNYPAVEAFESPFMALSNETERFVRHQRELLQELREDGIDHRQMQVLMDQCHELIRKVKRLSAQYGVSISLTYLMVRMNQTLERMELLLEFIAGDNTSHPLRLARFLKQMSRSEADSHSLRALMSRNTELLARNVTEHASETGDHYVTTSRSGFFDMWRSAARAGVIVAFMALLKIISTRLALAPLGQALVYSLNYSFGFMLIHILHGTIATKQPAMTASHLAASVEQIGTHRPEKHLGDLARLCIDVFRSQFIAILGNVGIAFPIAIAVGLMWQWLGHFPVSVDKANHLIHDLSPIDSLAIFHAAIAGFFLFLSGIISGYYDNKAIYSRIPERIIAHRALYWISRRRREKIAKYLRHNLGALAGNFYFGVMLGSMGTIGFLFGLPLDIRHIAFSTANFAYALVTFDFVMSWQVVAISSIGIAAIGMTNLGVSFSLALMLALKSRGVKFRLWWPLLQEIFAQLKQRPLTLFWPPKAVAESVPTN